jgi:phage head maturation protease
MAIVASTAPGNVWTSDEFAILVRDAVAKLLDVRPDELPTADDAEITDTVMQVCSEINCQVVPAGNA